MKEGVIFILAVVLLLPPAPCPETMCFVVKEKVLCLGFQKRTQLEISGNTVPEPFNPNIRVCSAHFTEDCFLNMEEYSTTPAVHKDCFYKVGQFQLYKDGLALTACAFSFLKNFLLSVVSLITNADVVIFTWRDATYAENVFLTLNRITHCITPNTQNNVLFSIVI